MSGPGGVAPAGTEVVALVASAGGLGALTAVLRALPEGFPAAVVVGQHLSGRGSVLVDILSRQISLPVVWAQSGRPVVAGHVTVCPPRSRVEVLPDRTCAVTPADAARDDRPLDALLTSVAESVGAAAAGVVLTGLGSDGARGAAALREAGGLVIAQSEDTAEYPSMPHAAVAAGAVRLVLPLYEIGPALVDAALGRQLALTRMRRRLARLDAFRVALTDTLRSMSEPAEAQARAAELLGRHLGAGRAYYQEFDRAAGTFTVHRNYTDGMPSLAGTYSLADYGDELVRDTLEAGRPLVVRDSADLPPEAAKSWAALSVRAGVSAPNFRGGVCVAALGITSAEPRDWTAEEIALVEETAERTWAFVERMRAETELRTSEKRFRTVADTVPALIWQNDADGNNVFVNRFFRDYTGLTDQQISGERWRALVHPDDAGDYLAGYLRAVRKRRVWQGRNRLRRHDGCWQTFDNYASPLLGADRTYLGHVGVSVIVSDTTPLPG